MDDDNSSDIFLLMTSETKITAGASIEQLPNDTSTLKQMVLTLLDQIDDLNGQFYYLRKIGGQENRGSRLKYSLFAFATAVVKANWEKVATANYYWLGAVGRNR